MAIFDQYITSVTDYVEELRGENRQVRELFASEELETIINKFTLNTKTKSGSNIVLKSDTFLELGNPAQGSCAITFYTDNPKSLSDGRITLIGADITESASASIPFGQVIIVGGEHITDDDYHQLLQYRNLSDQIEGYMVKSTSENIWSRISYDAAGKGLNLEVLGNVIMSRIKAEMPKVQSVEILFITSNKEDLLQLNKIEKSIRKISQNIKKKIWKDRGVDISECKPGGHCGSCEDKAVCDEINKIRTEHRKNS